MEKLAKEEYEILYYIVRGRNNLERLVDLFDKEIILKVIKKLENWGLLKIEYRDNDIYGFMETRAGEELLISSIYEEWYFECGD